MPPKTPRHHQMDPQSASTTQILEEENIEKTLFTKVMEGKWEEVIEIYEKHRAAAHNAKNIWTGDTAVHVAISDWQTSDAEKLITKAGDTAGALQIKNKLGYTPLHLAASLGNVTICERIAKLDSNLAGMRNDDNETPFFIAVRHGQKDAFLCLHNHCNGNGEIYGRRKDGETILHSAISGEYFDIAFEIIHLYPRFLNSFNELGLTPLHILASKPSAFRSGTHIRGFEKLIYHCIFADKLVKGYSYRTPSKEDVPKKNYPENYQTCADFLISIKHLILVLLGRDQDDRRESDRKKDGSSKKVDKEEGDPQGQHEPDPTQEQGSSIPETQGHQFFPKNYVISKSMLVKEEGDPEGQHETDRKQEQGSSISQTQGHQFFPKNYGTCFDALKLLSKSMLVIFGLGSMHIVKLREKKQKHIWSLQIMEAMLEKASVYEYEKSGRGPNLLPTKNGETTPYALTDGGTVNLNETNLLPGDDEDQGATSASASSADRGNNNPSTTISNKKPENGPTEMVERILQQLPAAADDMDSENKNVVLLALEKSENDFLPKVYSFLPKRTTMKSENELATEKMETPLLIAAKNGVTEMVERILQKFPAAVHDMNSEKKNVVLLAVENRQPHVYSFLLKLKTMKETIFRKRDKDGNSALHLAARLGEHRPWLIPGAALQMQWEIKWYEFVKNSMPRHFFMRYNAKGQTSRDIFSGTHRELVKEGGEWLRSTSNSCSVVAALIATVAFATASTVPGGVKSDNSGIPTLENQPAFCIFAVASLVALCFSVTALVMFLAILTSRYQEKDFGTNLPRKLLVGLTSLFVSIASILASFCAGHFFMLKDKLKYAAFPVYAVTCLPVTFFAVAQFPLYFDLARATFKKVPQRSYK